MKSHLLFPAASKAAAIFSTEDATMLMRGQVPTHHHAHFAQHQVVLAPLECGSYRYIVV